MYTREAETTNPEHMYCPLVSQSWCKWRKNEVKNTLDEFNHEPFHKDVEDVGYKADLQLFIIKQVARKMSRW
ncbi:hypothetical protein EAI_13295 [Harpegnathos saltator]|uniref:Uncharacterized protein n=1 Tax=Harpegnathos saltator TaxID=610380 RepID=E2BWF3_HARSA|nr:hypothetical protein EAI_13295 [Harpegnathos saltator]